jgi:zinc transporter ZupT
VALLVVGFAGMVPIGAGLALWLLRGIPASAVGALVALAAGTFLHIAADDMLPHVHQKGEGRGQALVALLLGIALMGAAGLGE